MINLEALYEALSLVFSFGTLLWILVGVILGVGVGALPGLSATSGVALMLPLAFTLPQASALGLIIGLYKGAVYGGSISAITFATPGTPDSAATVLDGYAMTKQGLGRKALLMALYASVTADLLSDVITIIAAPLLAIVATEFGPSERFWLVVTAISLLSALSGKHLFKGLLSAALGFYLATIGSDPIGAVSRNTFGIWWLSGGIELAPLVIGLFAMATMLEELVNLLKTSERVQAYKEKFGQLLTLGSEGLSLREYLRTWKEMMIGLVIGTTVGMLPGLGAAVGAFLSYSVAKQVSPHKKFGTGVIEGVAAAESGNNATVGPTLVPLLVLGIPGSSTAALIGGALMMHGVHFSPQVFVAHPVIIYSLFIILIISNFVNLGVGRVFAMIYARLALLPRAILIPLIMTIALVGSYAYRGSQYDVFIMLSVGILGYIMRITGIPMAPLVVTFLVTPLAEASLRRALIISRGDWVSALFDSPLSIGLCIVAVAVTVISYRLGALERLQRLEED